MSVVRARDQGVHAAAVAQVAALGGQGHVAALGRRRAPPAPPARRAPTRAGPGSPSAMPGAASGWTVTAGGPSGLRLHCDDCDLSVDSAISSRGNPGGRGGRLERRRRDGRRRVTRFTLPRGGGEAAVGEQHRAPPAGCARRPPAKSSSVMPCGPRVGAMIRSFHCRALPAITSARPTRAASACMISRSLFTPGGGGTTGRDLAQVVVAVGAQRCRRPRAGSWWAAPPWPAGRCRSGRDRPPPTARACGSPRPPCRDSGNIATGLPAVIHSARMGGSRAASTSGPNSGSQTERGAAASPRMKPRSKAARRLK